MTTRHLALAAALSASLVASTASADELVLETGITTAYYTDPSFDTVSDYNAQSNWTLGAAWGFDRLSGLQLGVLFQTTPRLTASRFGGDLYTEWGRQRFLGTLDWGFDVLRFLRPHVGGGVGYAHQYLSVDSLAFTPRLKDHTHDLTANVGLGLDVNVPYRWGRIAVTSSFGYELQTAARFDELRHDRDAFDDKYAPDDDPWDRARADFGSLRLNGLYWTIGLDLAFEL